MKVLIADGDAAFLEVAQCYLSHRGHEVRIAANGLDTVALVRRFVPDVVVLARELLWGGSDGVLAVMQQNPNWSEIPVILNSTGLSPQQSSTAARSFEAVQTQKSHRLEDLLNSLQACREDCAHLLV